MMFGLRGSCAIEGVEKTAVAIKSAAAPDENARLVVIFNSPLKDNLIDRTKRQTARRTWHTGLLWHTYWSSKAGTIAPLSRTYFHLL
jgi:hypothetical protein